MWHEQLAEVERQGLYRLRQAIDSPQGAEIIIDGRRLLNFSSNNYLGLANHPEVVEALRHGAVRYGVGAGASHLVCGHHRVHKALEEDLARFTGRERALLFSSGYMANLGVVSTIVGRHDTIFQDRLNHASLLDAARLAAARLKRYTHADPTALQLQLVSNTSKRKLIITDGVFSMDGDMAPLPDLVKYAQAHHASLMVDDAHGLGVIGQDGRGSVLHFGLTEEEVPILVGTLGKAFGTFGAFVAGPHDLIELLVQRARTFIYTTALPPALVEATRVALRLAQQESWRREVLYERVNYFRKGASALHLPVMPSHTPIQWIVFGDNQKVLEAGQKMREAGFLIGVIRPPTVPMGTARFRITFSADHTKLHIDALLDALVRVSR